MTPTTKRPGITTAPPPVQQGEAVIPSTRSWWGKYWKLVVPLAVTAMGLITVAAIAIAMMRGNGGNVATSAPAVVEAPAPAAAPVTAPVAPAASTPVAPVASEQKPAANAVSSTMGKGFPGKEFAPGKYQFKRIVPESPNVMVAAVALIISVGRLEAEDGDWLLVGSLQNIPTGSFVSPGDAVVDVNYEVSALLASPCADGSCVGFWKIDFDIYKTPSGEWRARSFETSERYLWDRGAFERRLSRANNEPSRLK